MELTLNLIWVIVAAFTVLSVLRSGAHSTGSKSSRLFTLAMLLLLLFPAISITDDLGSAQYLKEDGWSRRQETAAQTHLLEQNHSPALPALGFSVPGLRFAGRVPVPLRRVAFMLDADLFAHFIRPPPGV